MSFSSDSFFTIGVSHQICQDYALHAENAACISDGCSSVPFTDWGSRLFCQSYITSKFKDINAITKLVRGDLDQLNLPNTAGFATIFGIETKENGFLVKSIGDGYIAGKKHNGEVVIKSYRYSDNMPWYPIYNILGYDIKSMPATNKFVEDNKELDHAFGMIPNMGLYDYHTYQTVAVFSDGVDSFQDKNGKLDAEEAIEKLMKFSIYNGEFVKRRCIKQLKEWREQSLINYDDFSMAAIHKEVSCD